MRNYEYHPWHGVVVAVLLGFFGVLLTHFVLTDYYDWERGCLEADGVVIRGRGTDYCLKSDVIIHLNGEK